MRGGRGRGRGRSRSGGAAREAFPAAVSSGRVCGGSLAWVRGKVKFLGELAEGWASAWGAAGAGGVTPRRPAGG